MEETTSDSCSSFSDSEGFSFGFGLFSSSFSSSSFSDDFDWSDSSISTSSEENNQEKKSNDRMDCENDLIKSDHENKYRNEETQSGALGENSSSFDINFDEAYTNNTNDNSMINIDNTVENALFKDGEEGGEEISMNESMKLLNDNNPFCDICGEIFHSQATLDVHKLDHLISESYPCGICDHESKNREDYILHSRTHDCSPSNLTGTLSKNPILANSKPYHCDTCEKAFKFHSGFKRHMATHFASHVCNICSASFSSLLACHQHKLKHAKVQVHACDICKKTFQRPYQLSIHRQAHDKNKKYECVECATTYCYKTSLMRHTLKYHSPNSPKFQCDKCGELFKSKKMLNCHVILHTAKKLIRCPDCDLTFKYRSSYHRHKVIHKGQKPYRCNHCGKCFKKESILKTHKALHFANEDTYVCKLCDKTFAYQSFLIQHMLSHEITDATNISEQSD